MIIMIGDGSEGIKSSRSMIDETILKLVWLFLELDLFSKLKPIITYLLTGFQMKNGFSSENVLIRKTFLETILSDFFKYIIYFFIVIHC